MFKQEIFNSLIAWLGGVGLVQVITEYLKKPFSFVKDKKLLGYVLSVIVSFAVTRSICSGLISLIIFRSPRAFQQLLNFSHRQPAR